MDKRTPSWTKLHTIAKDWTSGPATIEIDRCDPLKVYMTPPNGATHVFRWQGGDWHIVGLRRIANV